MSINTDTLLERKWTGNAQMYAERHWEMHLKALEVKSDQLATLWEKPKNNADLVGALTQ
jgi:hypothetical protein